jgi:hypothetical protein
MANDGRLKGVTKLSADELEFAAGRAMGERHAMCGGCRQVWCPVKQKVDVISKVENLADGANHAGRCMDRYLVILEQKSAAGESRVQQLDGCRIQREPVAMQQVTAPCCKIYAVALGVVVVVGGHLWPG